MEIISRKALVMMHKGGTAGSTSTTNIAKSSRAVRPVAGAERLYSSGVNASASASASADVSVAGFRAMAISPDGHRSIVKKSILMQSFDFDFTHSQTLFWIVF